MNQDELKVRQEVLETAKRAVKDQMMAGTSGNISALLADGMSMAITPSGYDYSIMTVDDIVVIDFEGNVISGHLRPSSEWKLHAQLYKELKRVRAVVHTHSPYATSFAVLRKEIPVVLIEMVPFLKGSIEVSDYAKQGSWQVGMNAVEVLKEKNACLMANHGAVTVGSNLYEAYINSVYTEDAAKIYHRALAVGTPYVLKQEEW